MTYTHHEHPTHIHIDVMAWYIQTQNGKDTGTDNIRICHEDSCINCIISYITTLRLIWDLVAKCTQRCIEETQTIHNIASTFMWWNDNWNICKQHPTYIYIIWWHDDSKMDLFENQWQTTHTSQNWKTICTCNSRMYHKDRCIIFTMFLILDSVNAMAFNNYVKRWLNVMTTVK